MGGWRSSGTSTDGIAWTWKIVSGFVVVDPAAKLTAGFGRGVTRGSLLMHELGHVAGLNHTSQTSQVMASSLSSTQLRQLGHRRQDRPRRRRCEPRVRDCQVTATQS